MKQKKTKINFQIKLFNFFNIELKKRIEPFKDIYKLT